MRLSDRHNFSPGSRGSVLIYTTIAILVILACLSLAVDFGRAQNAKTELQNAIDAAARYAATGLSDSTYVAKAQEVAQQNAFDGGMLSLQTSEVESGTWNATTRVFTSGGAAPNAVRVSVTRSVPTPLSSMLGRSSVGVRAQAIAQAATQTLSPDVVGLTTVTITGSGSIRRWSSESGTVTVASNGTYSLSWGQYIYGDVLYRGTEPNPPGNGITGTKTAMSSNIACAAVSTPGSATNLGAVSWTNGGSYSISGTYRASSVDIGGGANLTITGDTTIYCSGQTTIGNGATINTSGTARTLTLYQTGTSQVTLNMSSLIYMRIYAPNSTVTLSGSTPFIGSIVAKDLVVQGSASLSYSSALPIPVAPTGGTTSGGSGGSITMVR